MRKIALLIISLSLVACGDEWPVTPPIIMQCQFNWTNERPQGAWFCVSTHPKKEDRVTEILETKDPRMKGAQALSPEDYKKSEAWVKDIKTYYRENCK
jgi:hypothetical protein